MARFRPFQEHSAPYRRRLGRLEDEVAPLLAPRIDGEGRPDFSDAHVPALADGARAELLPLERAVGAVVLLDHARKGPPRPGQLAIVAGPDAGRQIMRVVEQGEA